MIMDNVKHTPGPWSISLDDDQWPVVMASGKIVANVNPESFSAGVADLVEMPADANARLIAAAPELLEALVAAEKALNEIRVCCHHTAWDQTGPAVMKARAAIAKATGGA